MIQGHPVRNLPNFRRRAIPLSLHGDGVPVTGVGKSWGESMDIYSWNSLLGSGSTLQFNFYIWSIFQVAVNESHLNNLDTKKGGAAVPAPECAKPSNPP